MLTRCFRILFVVGFVLAAITAVMGQNADAEENRFFGRPDKRPKPIKESLERMRIENAKKEYDEMIARGDEVLRLSKRLEMAFGATGRLEEREMAELAAAEKIAKKIRQELGGRDDNDDSEGQTVEARSKADMVKSFRAAAIDLFDELQKTTRFTISAAAIQSANSVARLARFLRISK